MNVRPELARLTRQWIAIAEEDLLNAEHTLTLRENCPVSTVCFHAQQCAEKYLKALLTCREIEFPKTHDLVALYNRLGKESGVDTQVADLQPLNRYSVESRYPGVHEPIDRRDASAAVDTARSVRDAVRSVLPPDVLHGEA